MATRPPDKVVKNPLLTSADQNAFFEEFAHSRLLVAPPAPPISSSGAGHASTLGKEVAEVKDLTTPALPPLQAKNDQDSASEQAFDEIPLTPSSTVLLSPAHPPPAPSGPPPSGPPPSTGFIRSAPLSRYIPSNFIQTSLPTQASFQVIQNTPSAPIGVSLLDPSAGIARDSADAKTAESTQNTNDQAQTAVVATVSAVSLTTPPGLTSAPSTCLPPRSSTSPPAVSTPSFTPYIPKSTSYPVSSAPNFGSPSAGLASSQSTNLPFVPVFPKPQTGNFVPNNPINLQANENVLTGLVPHQLRSPQSSSPGWCVPTEARPLSSAERGSPSTAQTPNASGQIETSQSGPENSIAPSSVGASVAQSFPPAVSSAQGQSSTSPAPPPVGPPPRGNSSAYPSALSRSGINRSALGQHSSSSLRRSPLSKAPAEVQFFTPAPACSVLPPSLDQTQPPDNFLTHSQPAEEPDTNKSIFASAASFFNLGGIGGSGSQASGSDSGSVANSGQAFFSAPSNQPVSQNNYNFSEPAPPSTSYFQLPQVASQLFQAPPLTSSKVQQLPGLSQQSRAPTFTPQLAQPPPATSQKFQTPAVFQSPPATSQPLETPAATQQLPSPPAVPQPFQAPPPSSQPFQHPPVASQPYPYPPSSFQFQSTFPSTQPYHPPPPVSQGFQPPPPQPQQYPPHATPADSAPPQLTPYQPQSSSRPSSVGSASSLQSAGFPPVSSPFPPPQKFSNPPPSSYFTPISDPSVTHQSPSPPRSFSSQGSISSIPKRYPAFEPQPQTSGPAPILFNPNHFSAPQAPSAFSDSQNQQHEPSANSFFSSLNQPCADYVQNSVSEPAVPQTVAQSEFVATHNFSNASSFFQPATAVDHTDSFQPEQAQETKLPSFPPQHLNETKPVTPSHTPPPSYESLDYEKQSSSNEENPIDQSDGSSFSQGQNSAAPPTFSSSQGTSHRPTVRSLPSYERLSYAPVPGLGANSHEIMGQTQPPSGPLGANLQDAPPMSEADRAHSNSPPSPSTRSQSMDFSGQASSGGHYRPAFHHWFYKKDGKRAVWHPFSMADSLNIEQAFVSSDVADDTKVQTDGGRYDVHVLRRTKTSVYWEEPPSEVRRCSWFSKSPTESRYIPYDENIAEILEEAYKQGSLSNEWDRRIELADGEVIILSSPNAMAHHQRSSSPDNWGNPPAMPQKPRIVKRGLEDFEISEGEPTQVDHLILVVHGIGKVCDLRFRSLVEVVDDFRAISLQLIQSHFRRGSESGLVGRVEVLPVEWHQALHTEAIDKRLADITLPSIPKAREFTNDTILDVLFYSSPMFSEKIQQAVGAELNRTYSLFMERNPRFTGGVSLGGHSLGSLILFDMLTHQKDPKHPSGLHQPTINEDGESSQIVTHNSRPSLSRRMSFLSIGLQGATQPVINFPQLNFHPKAFFAFGSPIGMFLTVRGIESLGEDFKFPTCSKFFNIFHPNDPVAYRIEALISNEMANVPPVLIPHHKGRKRMHLELKETMAHITAALKQKLVQSVRSTWNTVFQLAMFQRPDSSLQREVDKALEEEVLRAPDVEPPSPALSSTQSVADDQGLDLVVGSLNGGNRIDYVLQEAPLETFNQYISAVRSHVVYWESEDTLLMVLKEIYATKNIKPDSQVPQQILPFDINSEDHYGEYTDSIGAPPAAFVRK